MNYARRTIGGTMLLVICSAIAALACNDIERPTEIRAGSKPVAEQQAPPVISSLTCTFRRDVATISCSPALPPVAAGVSASVIYGTGTPGTAQYGIFYAVNLVKNLTTQKWSFTAYVQNLLKQSIGTLNGTTVTGVKVFVTDFHATAGTGTVSVANPDGIGTFTAPNQPYFNYNQIVAPNGYTANKVWQFNVPNTVTAVSMSILISTDFPAEQSVTLAPPTSFPDWVHADTNISARTDSVHVRFTKRILLVRFKATATLADRQLAVAVVNGAVVGGNQNPDGSGFYYVQVPDDGTGAPLFSAGRQMSKLPQVQSATPEVALDQLELKPHDGGDWQKWTLSPDSVDTSKQNWALEEIDAPYAWGCSTGDSTTKVGMVDHGFRTPNDLLANLPVASYALNPPDTGTHATQVAGVLTATGNNSIAGGSAGITGAMWRSSLQIEDALIDPSPPHHFGPGTPRELVDRVVQLAQRGVKVANISLGLVYQTKLGAYIAPSSYEDSSAAIGSMINFIDGLHDARLKGFALPLPLLVIGSGDFAQSPGTAAATDAWWSALPQLRDSLGDTVLVVGASTRNRSVAYFSGVNVTHSYVQIMAPGDSVWALDPTNSPKRNSGTSLSAPYVTGAAGLLLSFDPTIGGAGAGHGPPELKQLILSGADSNTTPSGVVRTAGAYRFLSLYKPLVMAAKRKGAPLCRNRVWISGKSIVVRRTATMTDTIYSGAANVNYSLYLTTYHGGRRLDFTNVVDDTLSSQQTLYQQHGAWSAQALGPPNEYSLSGSQNSHSDYYDFYYGGRSHNADSVVDFQFVGGARPPTGAPIQLLVYDSARTTLLRTLAPITSSVMNVWATTYSPRGDALYAAVTSNPYIGMEYWKLPLNGATPTRLWTLPNGLASSLAVSEDGTELVADVEQQNSPHYTCWTEYRGSATGIRLDSVGRIDHDDCSVYHQGAASASRAHLLTLRQGSSVGRSTLQSLFH